MADYAKDAADALASIKEAGRQGVLRHVTKTLSMAGSVTAYTTTGGTIDMVVLTVSKGDPLDESLNEALTRGSLRKLLVAAASAPTMPVSTDLVLFEGKYWTVHGCTPLKPATTPILYTLIVEDTGTSQAARDALNLNAEEAVIAAT